jgi:hypothetical protein
MCQVSGNDRKISALNRSCFPFSQLGKLLVWLAGVVRYQTRMLAGLVLFLIVAAIVRVTFPFYCVWIVAA